MFSKHYDEHLSFRVLEALRNYAQHRGLPVQGLTLTSRWLDIDAEDGSLEYNAALNIIISELESDKDFKRAVLAELKILGGADGVVDIKSMIREYVQSIAYVHEDFREMSDELVKGALALISDWTSRYKEVCSDDSDVALAVGWINANRTRERIVYLSGEQIDQLSTLRSRTRSTRNLARRFATTSPVRK